jgi:adenylosuccinate synthase
MIMSITAIVGANWGDEGKGKVTDVLAANARYVVRYQGGSNAGHTIINPYGKFALHLLPSGVFYPDVVNVIGPGVAFNIGDFLKEYDELIARGVPQPLLRVSDRAQVVLPYHKWFDELEEERLGDLKFGSTKAGIAPFYADKYLKLGVQVADLYDENRLRRKLEASLVAKNVLLTHLYHKQPIQVDDLIGELLEKSLRLKPFVCVKGSGSRHLSLLDLFLDLSGLCLCWCGCTASRDQTYCCGNESLFELCWRRAFH